MDGYTPNTCEYDNCGRQFLNIRDLVLHIEAIHIDFTAEYDVSLLHGEAEDFPLRGLPMSMVLKYSDDEELDDVREKEERSIGDPPYFFDDSCVSFTESDMGDLPPKRSTSKAYWCSSPELFMHKRVVKTFKTKKYACPMLGCTKTYKNPNGMKYHVMNFHEHHGNFMKPHKAKKEYKCDYCFKEYKTLRGFQSHYLAHQGSPPPSSQAPHHVYYGGEAPAAAVGRAPDHFYDVDGGGYIAPPPPSGDYFLQPPPPYVEHGEGVYFVDGGVVTMTAAGGLRYDMQHVLYNQPTTAAAAAPAHQPKNAPLQAPPSPPMQLPPPQKGDASSAEAAYEEFSFLQGYVSSETNATTIEEVTMWKLKNGEVEEEPPPPPLSRMTLEHMRQQMMMHPQQLCDPNGFALNEVPAPQRYMRLPAGGATGRPEAHGDGRDITRSNYEQLTYEIERVELCD